MRLNYNTETDSWFINLPQHSSVDSQEISAGIALEYDVHGRLVK